MVPIPSHPPKNEKSKYQHYYLSTPSEWRNEREKHDDEDRKMPNISWENFLSPPQKTKKNNFITFLFPFCSLREERTQIFMCFLSPHLSWRCKYNFVTHFFLSYDLKMLHSLLLFSYRFDDISRALSLR